MTKVLSDDQYLTMLDRKLLEETNEYLECGSTEELTDAILSGGYGSAPEHEAIWHENHSA